MNIINSYYLGAYYYYKTEPQKNYEQTMLDLLNKTVFTFK